MIIANLTEVKARFALDERILLIFKEHHDTRYFCAASEEEIGDICLHMLRDRNASHYYDPDEKPTEPEGVATVLAKLEDTRSALRDTAEAEMEKYLRGKAAYERSVREFALATSALETNNGVKAFWMLSKRRRYEDEGFEMIAFEEPTMAKV